MIGMLMGLGLGKRMAQVVGYVLVPALVLLAIWLLLDAYGDSRYKAGVEVTDAKWVEAGERLKEDAAASATRADDRAAARLEEHAEQVQEERKALDEAERTGASPLDVLFGA